MTRLACLLVAALLAPPAAAEPISITDGDTIRIGDERIRIMGYDAPELFSPECATEFERARMAKWMLGILLASDQVAIERHGTDRYDRTLAEVTVEGASVARLMIGLGLGRPYDGGRREGWCDE